MTRPNSSNRYSINYQEQAQNMQQLPFGIIDVHSHIDGDRAVSLYAKIAESFGVTLTYSMTALEHLPRVKERLQHRIQFIAIPRWGGDPLFEHGPGYNERLKSFHAHGVRIAKFWSAPRIYDYSHEPYHAHPLKLNSPLRKEAMKCAKDLGMKFMVHVADPDTWFASKYSNADRYGTKRAQYDALEEVLQEFAVPTIAAHMGGWPENLMFLSDLLGRYPHLYLDTSATKWMVRELSKHEPGELTAFFSRWKGRVLFGSDIVTMEEHLHSTGGESEMAKKASNEEDAYDLYASRYWALRTLFESQFEGESPIADPDLAMIEPSRFHALDAPRMRGCSLPIDLLKSIYHDSARAFFAL